MKAYAVIGAGYGDEGKGLVTDYLAQVHHNKTTGKPPLVARGNGGAQAGHTVHYGKNRFVFGHVSSGTFAGSDTYLGSQFIVNPLMLDIELTKLADMNERPNIFVHPYARVTTIFDMAINSLVEISRGGGRHGSCGAGINETVTRHAAGYRLTPQMLREDEFNCAKIMDMIKQEWVPARLKELGIDLESLPASAKPYIDALQTRRSSHTNHLARLCGMLIIKDGASVVKNDEVMISEGAQGLLLDEFLGVFPHVTRSITGLPSHIRVAAECGATEIQPIYVTRAYATRHGAGPLAYEGERICTKQEMIVDATNVPNQWQGTLRFAPLDVGLLHNAIHDDMARAAYASQQFGVNVLKPKLVVTCMDQISFRSNIRASSVLANFNFEDIPHSELAGRIAQELELDLGATSYGPAAKDVRLQNGGL